MGIIVERCAVCGHIRNVHFQGAYECMAGMDGKGYGWCGCEEYVEED